MFLTDELGLDDFAFFAWGAHLHSESRREADELSTPLPALSLRDLYWRAYRAMLDLGARWSEGLKIGKATGYDSAARSTTFTATARKAATRSASWPTNTTSTP